MMWPFDRAPAAHIRREYKAPQPLAETFARYATVAELPRNHGTDPLREAKRAAALAHPERFDTASLQSRPGGPFRISPIAETSEPLPVGRTQWDSRRRLWRFRACDAITQKCVFEQYVESETPEGAVEAGRMHLERHAREYGISGSQALIGSILAV
jgi:hypothetical protein